MLSPSNGNGLPSTERGSSIPIGRGEAAPPFEDEGGVSINPLNSGDPLMAPTTASAIYKITKKQIHYMIAIYFPQHMVSCALRVHWTSTHGSISVVQTAAHSTISKTPRITIIAFVVYKYGCVRLKRNLDVTLLLSLYACWAFVCASA